MMKLNKKNIILSCLLFFCTTITFANNFNNVVKSCNGDYALWSGVGSNQIAGGQYMPYNITVKIKEELSEKNPDQYQGIFLASGMNVEYRITSVSLDESADHLNNKLKATLYKENNEVEQTMDFLVDKYGSLIIQTDLSDKTSFHFVGCSRF